MAEYANALSLLTVVVALPEPRLAALPTRLRLRPDRLALCLNESLHALLCVDARLPYAREVYAAPSANSGLSGQCCRALSFSLCGL
jgi:hypothetical protein